MVAAAQQGTESELPPEHIIFQICLKCHSNTLRTTECAPEVRGPGFRCPTCQKSTFVTACTICRFESSSECPLKKLLLKRSKPAGVERRGRERVRKGDEAQAKSGDGRSPVKKGSAICPSGSRGVVDKTRGCHEILESFKSNGDKIHTTPHRRSQRNEDSISPKSITRKPQQAEAEQSSSLSHTEAPETPLPPTGDQLTTDAPRILCTQCSQSRCSTCKPGFVNLVVDMKEFSTTFAEGMALCTMCEHWLCPGSSLVVLYRCRDCGHEGCDGCTTRDDRMGDVWVDCCRCMNRETSGETEENEI